MPNFYGFGGKKKSSSSKSSKSSSKVDRTRCLCLGIEKSGKTSLLYTMKLGEVVTTVPTIGFNVETLDFGSKKSKDAVTFWDVGGQSKIRPLWRHYTADTGMLVYCINGSEPNRLDEATAEFNNLYDNCFETPPLALAIVITHVDKLTDKDILQVRDEIENRCHLSDKRVELGDENCEIFEVVAVQSSNEGEHELMDWLKRTASNKKSATKDLWGNKSDNSASAATKTGIKKSSDDEILCQQQEKTNEDDDE